MQREQYLKEHGACGIKVGDYYKSRNLNEVGIKT